MRNANEMQMGGLRALIAGLALAGIALLPSSDAWAGPEEATVAAPAAPAPAAPAAVPPTSEVPPPAADDVEPPPALEFYDDVIVRADGTTAFFYRTEHVAPKDLIAALKASGFDKLLNTGGTTSKSTATLREVAAQNTVILEGDPDAVDIVLEAIAYFDVAAPQVFIEAKVIEVNEDANFEVGINYLWDRDAAGPDTIFRGAESVLNPPTFLRSTFPPKYPFQGTSLILGLVGSNADEYGALGLAIQALQLSGKADLLSNPTIIATQGVKATVKTEESRPVVVLETANRNGENFRSAPVKTGVTLEVTPKHIGRSYVTLEIKPTVKGVAGLASNRTGGTFAPITTLREISTTVTLGDGETLILGGLYTNESRVEKARTPLLSDIPLLGHLFTRTNETKTKSELIFILTPTIVRKTKDLKIIVPPAELERLDKAKRDAEEGGGERCTPGLTPPKQIDPPPGFGARYVDE